MKTPSVSLLLALAQVFAGPLAAQPASAARTVPSLELPRYKTSGKSDAPRLASTKVTVDDLAPTGPASARAATRNDVPYLAVDAGKDLSRPLRGGPRDVTFVSFQLQGSAGTTLDIAGARLSIGPANKDGFAPLRVGQPNGNNKTPTWRDLPHVVKVETFDGAPLAVLPVVTVRLDPVAGNWDLSIFQRLVAEDLPLINPPRGANKTFDLHAGSRGAWLSALVSSDENPLHLDANRNGVDDTFEKTQNTGVLLATTAPAAQRTALVKQWQEAQKAANPRPWSTRSPAPDGTLAAAPKK
jgi:hypothetical protein